MTKLPQTSSKELIVFLGKYGFQYDRTKGSHHVLKHSDGRIVTVPERKVLGKGLLSSILAQAGISREEFMGN